MIWSAIRFIMMYGSARAALHSSGYVEETVKMLADKGATYEKEGALWLRSTDFGCEKDDVLRRANGFYTYFAADIAYHRNKFEKRGFDRVINIWGADHHGHVHRLKSALDALGLDGSHRLEIVLMAAGSHDAGRRSGSYVQAYRQEPDAERPAG